MPDELEDFLCEIGASIAKLIVRIKLVREREIKRMKESLEADNKFDDN